MTANANREFKSTCSASRFRKAARRITQIYDQLLEPYGLTITQYGLLGHLKYFDGISVGSLAEKLVMDPTTLTRNLRPLERQGFVSLTQDDKDRRSRKLSLTETGLEKYKAARPGWQAAQERIANVLGPEDGRLLSSKIDQMIEDLRE
jgi:DNA-binding MarR family transcriptional regulator